MEQVPHFHLAVFRGAGGVAQRENHAGTTRRLFRARNIEVAPLVGDRETTDRAKALLLAAKTLPRMSWLLVILFALTAVAAVQYGPELAATGAIGILLTTLGTWLSPAGKVVRTLYDAWQKKNALIESEPPPAPVKAEQPPESAAPPPAPATAVPASAPPQQQQTEMKAAPAAKAVETTNVDYLTLQKWETEDMKVMYPLIPSPRAAKRFVNTYRLLRGMVDEYEQAAFVGDGAALAGDYRAALLMLAMLTGYPEETTEILRELLTSAAPDPDWWSFVEARVKGEPLREQLAAIKPSLLALPPTATFAKWAPHVARFSFHSGRVVSAGPILGAT